MMQFCRKGRKRVTFLKEFVLWANSITGEENKKANKTSLKNFIKQLVYM